jgi:hypothetical protein
LKKTFYEISEINALNVTVFAEDETRIYCVLPNATPSVNAIESFPATTESYTTQFAAAGVPSVDIIAILYVAEEEDVFTTRIVEMTAVVDADVPYSVA